MTDKPTKPLTPEQRIKELERQLKDEKQKSALFETVINIMRDEHGVIVKKHSGKLSVVVKSKD
jgi:inosine/xanthosine triphosphate pyrophosphatase family protein